MVIGLNKDWLFSKGEVFENPQSVCLPHSVELTPENSSGCRNYQGLCHYKKEIFIPKEYEGQKLILEFEGAMGSAVLYINGKAVAEHFCGYTPFVIDAGEFFEYDKNNELYITLDNSDNPTIPPGKPQKDLDFSYDGGLYRDVTLSVFNPLYITNPILTDEIAGGGIYVWYENVSQSSAQVCFRVQVKNEYSSLKKYTLCTKLTDADGEAVSLINLDGCLEKGNSEYLQGSMEVPNPRLWDTESPYLYNFIAEIFCDNESVCKENLKIGIRAFKYTVNNGVIFNGKEHRFNSANYHQTYPYLGNGVPTNLLIRDLIKIKRAGFDNIRSHYPFSSAFVEACDRMGLTLIVSNPGWQFCCEGLFLERAKQNMRNIVRWQRNHPSIILWEPILNESEMNFELQKAFADIVHEEYPFGDCYTASDYGPTDVAYCEYDPGMLGSDQEKFGLVEQKDNTPRPMWVREYGDAPDNFFDQNAVWRTPRAWGDFPMVESVNRMLHKFDTWREGNHQYIDVSNNKRLCGYGIWPVISHNRGYHINPCWGGHLDLFRIPKFSYYFMQSQQDREKAGDVIFIANWWSEMSPPDITVFSNAQSVRLYCDERLIAEQKPDDVGVKHPPFTFKDVKRKFKGRNRSELKAEAIVDEEVVATYSVFAPGIARNLKLEADFEGIALKADGADIVAVRCSMIDDMGNVVPYSCDNHPIIFSVEGEGVIVGDEKIGANPKCPEAGIATVLVKSTQNAGEIKLTAKMLWEQNTPRAIKPAELIIKSI